MRHTRSYRKVGRVVNIEGGGSFVLDTHTCPYHKIGGWWIPEWARGSCSLTRCASRATCGVGGMTISGGTIGKLGMPDAEGLVGLIS